MRGAKLLSQAIALLLFRGFPPLANLTLTAAWALLCLAGLAQAWPVWGIIPAIGIMAGLFHLGFLISRYLNDLASSRQRATVLIVKGLLFNIGYGSASLLFAGAVSFQKGQNGLDDNGALVAVLNGQPWIFAAAFAVFLRRGKVDWPAQPDPPGPGSTKLKETKMEIFKNAPIL